MIEVEAKARISNPKKYMALAAKLGKYKGKQLKVDDYYTLASLSSYPKKSLRIRRTGKFYTINFKHKMSSYKGIQAKRETEFRVSRIDDFLALIKDFGFKKWLRKEKQTWLFEVKKNLHIEINKVKGLGWFVEVEYLCGSGKVKTARKEVVEAMEHLGIHSEDFIEDGYTKMLWAAKH